MELLYCTDLSFRTIGRILKFNASTIMRWVKKYADTNCEKPAPKGELVIELDEMWHFLHEKKQMLDLESLLQNTGQLIDWECGSRNTETLSRLLERLEKFDVKMYFTDKWESYNELIPPERLIQTKAETFNIERNNGQMRHWFVRFRRRTCVVSRSLEMVNATLALFAHFHNEPEKYRLFNLFALT